MSSEIIYEYALLRYVPDLQRGEFINVGLMMMSKRHRWLRVALKVDSARIIAFCPKSDTTLLRQQLALFERTDVPAPELPVEERYRWLAAVKSAIIQTSPSHPGIILTDQEPAEALNGTFNRLFTELV